MSSGRGTPGRRLRLVPGLRHHGAEEAPRVEALDALLREVDGLRLTLETDLTMAASAVESGSPQMAAEILDSDRSALRRFEERALDQLALLEAHDEVPRQHRSLWSQAHAGPVVAAAALVGLLIGLVPHVLRTSSAPPSTTVAASDSLERLQQLAAHGDPDQVRAASLALHEQLAGVVANAKTDPVAAQTALLLLSYEQSAIVRSGDGTALADVLQQSRALARAIVAALPKAVESVVPSVAPDVVRPEPSRSPRPEPHPAATGSPRPGSAASAHPSASPSPSKSDGYPLPSNPIAP